MPLILPLHFTRWWCCGFPALPRITVIFAGPGLHESWSLRLTADRGGDASSRSVASLSLGCRCTRPRPGAPVPRPLARPSRGRRSPRPPAAQGQRGGRPAVGRDPVPHRGKIDALQLTRADAVRHDDHGLPRCRLTRPISLPGRRPGDQLEAAFAGAVAGFRTWDRGSTAAWSAAFPS